MTDALGALLQASFSPRGLRIAVPAALATVIGIGGAFSAVEGRSLWDGLWWAAVTVTTVGYGDVVPHSTGGRVLGVVLMLGGIGFLLLLAGALVEHFVSVEVEEHAVLTRLDELTRTIEALREQIDSSAVGAQATVPPQGLRTEARLVTDACPRLPSDPPGDGRYLGRPRNTEPDHHA